MRRSDLLVQTDIISLHFLKKPNEIENEEILEWINTYSGKFRKIWDSGEGNTLNIMKELYTDTISK